MRVQGPYTKTVARQIEDQAIFSEGAVFNSFEPHNMAHLQQIIRTAKRNAHRCNQPHERAKAIALKKNPGRPEKYIAAAKRLKKLA